MLNLRIKECANQKDTKFIWYQQCSVVSNLKSSLKPLTERNIDQAFILCKCEHCNQRPTQKVLHFDRRLKKQ